MTAGRKNWPWTVGQRKTLKQIKLWRRQSKTPSAGIKRRVTWSEIADRLNEYGWLGPGGKWTKLAVAKQANKKPKPKPKKMVVKRHLQAHEYLSYDEIVKCQNACPPRDLLIFDFLVQTGLRPGCEFAVLQVRDLRATGAKPKVHIRHGKGDKERFVTLNREMAARLAEQCGRRAEFRPIFLNSYGEKLTADTLRKRLRVLGEKAGVGRLYPYRCRHSFGCILYDNGKDLKNVADQMGHADINTTTIYAEVWENADIEQAEGMAERLRANQESIVLEVPCQIPVEVSAAPRAALQAENSERY